MSAGKTLVVVHGKSELIFCRGLASNLKLNVEFDHESRGETCIQIRQLRERFSSYPYDAERNLHKKFDKLEYLGKEPVKMPNLKIFPIMDTDDSQQDEKSYKTRNLFQSSIIRDRIIPIFNTPNLDAVLNECGFKININDKIESYHKLVEEYDLNGLIDGLKDCNNTNLPTFLSYCASLTPSYQSIA
jgi:hypothetical protein